jgi:hypothetical protein
LIAVALSTGNNPDHARDRETNHHRSFSPSLGFIFLFSFTASGPGFVRWFRVKKGSNKKIRSFQINYPN